jgi:hypothetical protein
LDTSNTGSRAILPYTRRSGHVLLKEHLYYPKSEYRVVSTTPLLTGTDTNGQDFAKRCANSPKPTRVDDDEGDGAWRGEARDPVHGSTCLMAERVHGQNVNIFST